MKTFTESQKINIWWAWLPLGFMSLFFLYELVQYLINGSTQWINIDQTGLLIMIGAIALTAIILALAELRTHINAEGITAHFKPFNKKKFFWSEVETYSIRKSNVKSIGLKYSPFQKMLYYNTHIGEMLILKLRNGKKFGIGTKDPERMRAFLEELFDSDEYNLLEDLQKNKEISYIKERRKG